MIALSNSFPVVDSCCTYSEIDRRGDEFLAVTNEDKANMTNSFFATACR